MLIKASRSRTMLCALSFVCNSATHYYITKVNTLFSYIRHFVQDSNLLQSSGKHFKKQNVPDIRGNNNNNNTHTHIHRVRKARNLALQRKCITVNPMPSSFTSNRRDMLRYGQSRAQDSSFLDKKRLKFWLQSLMFKYCVCFGMCFECVSNRRQL